MPLQSPSPAPPLIPLLLLSAVLAAGTAGFLAGCGQGETANSPRSAAPGKTLYTCGMDPQVIQDHPGNCPICGMKLTPIKRPLGSDAAIRGSGERPNAPSQSAPPSGEAHPTPGAAHEDREPGPAEEMDAAGATIAVDPVTSQNMGIRTALVTRGPLRRTIRTVGIIDYDETSLAEVTPRVSGWVEKLYVNMTGQPVRRGEPLFEIYSPELYSAQREYLLAWEQPADAPGADSLRHSARTRLRLLDISDEQIDEIERAGEPRKTLRLVAPRDGFVIEKSVVEGQRVAPGERLYRLADLARVWVLARIYEQDLGCIQPGQEALITLSSLPGREFRGHVSYLYPGVEEKTRTAQVRLELPNPGGLLKPGMFATVQIVSELEPDALRIPNMAILRSGTKNTVFVARDGGRFTPRTVTLGAAADDDTCQVLSGLSEGERIVTSGQFLLDSESQLREAIQKMLEPGAITPPASADPVEYTCPMEEDAEVRKPGPGQCPKCGMNLVPAHTVPHGRRPEPQP